MLKLLRCPNGVKKFDNNTGGKEWDWTATIVDTEIKVSIPAGSTFRQVHELLYYHHVKNLKQMEKYLTDAKIKDGQHIRSKFRTPTNNKTLRNAKNIT